MRQERTTRKRTSGRRDDAAVPVVAGRTPAAHVPDGVEDVLRAIDDALRAT